MLPTLTLGANMTVSIMATMFVLVCLFMMLIILIQKPKGGGLSGAFGGAGGSAQAAFGAKTGDLLTTITIGCFVLFLGLAIGLTYAIRDDVAPKAAAPVSSATIPSIPTDEPADPLELDVTAPADSTDEVDASTELAPAEPADTEPATAGPETVESETSEPEAAKPDAQP
jgi:preprotein translocase subunit SecG